MRNDSGVMMGKLQPSWGEERAKSITFCVTEDCNLACKYCYLTGKNGQKKMNFETAKNAVDYILSNRDEFPEDSIIWDFIGGEPFLEIDLIKDICDYIKYKMYTLNHPWFNSYRFNFSTNGVLYHTSKVQEFIKKNIKHVSVGISVDGNKIKHDLQRVKPDGSGSYDDVVKNVPLWLEQFPNGSTKATFSHDDLPYLKASIISLWNIGIRTVAANVVFEDVWEDGDDIIMESQLKELADYVIENKLWEDYSVRFFDPNIGFPLSEEEKQQNFCGAGRMLAIDCDGNFFPCVRFLDFSLSNQKGIKIGSISEGINHDRIRPFLGLTLKAQSKPECVDCDVASGCAWCQGCNYDLADSDTIYQRATYMCNIHKATVRTKNYFWDRLEELTGLITERKRLQNLSNRQGQGKFPTKYMEFITSDSITPHCSYRNIKGTANAMNLDTFNSGIDFCRDNGFLPVLLSKPNYSPVNIEEFILVGSVGTNGENDMTIYDNTVEYSDTSSNSILLVNRENIGTLLDMTENLFTKNDRINLIQEDIEKWNGTDIEEYARQLDSIIPLISDSYKAGTPIELSVLTDIWSLKSMRNCDAGQESFALAPNGKIYICPAFYFDDPHSYIGSLEQGIDMRNSQLLELENAPICSVCDVYGCRRCKYLNKKLSGEYNTPSKIQCTISHLERNKSMQLQRIITGTTPVRFENELKEINYTDPLDKLLVKGGTICV